MNIAAKIDLLILLIGIVLVFSLFAIIYLLRYLDMKINYEKKGFKYKIFFDAGVSVVRAPYLFWQAAKKKSIEKYFATTFEFENKIYETSIPFKNQPHFPLSDDLLPKCLYRDFLTKIESIKADTSKASITTIINGDHNIVTVEQNEINNISTQIDRFIKCNNDIEDYDRQLLELFKYKIMAKEASENDAKKVVSVLNKYVPYVSLATALITIIKSIFM